MSPRRKSPARAATVSAELPVLPLRDNVLFPHVLAPLFVDRERSLRAVEAALADDQTVVIVAQRDAEVERPAAEDLYQVGTEAVIGRVLKLPDGSTSVLVQGQRRVQLARIVREDQFLVARATAVVEPVPPAAAVEALMRAVLGLYERVVRLSRTIPDDHYVAATNAESPGWLADLVASDLDLPIAQRQDLLETFDPVDRLHKVSVLLAKELDVLELQDRIHAQVQQEVERSQREYFLREQLRAIQRELGEDDPQAREQHQLREKIEAAGLPPAVRARAEEELERLLGLPPLSPETGMIRAYLDWLTALPWATETEDQLDVARAAEVLEANHHGLERVKERILEHIAVRKLRTDAQRRLEAETGTAGARAPIRSPVLCFVGPPGVGKTSLGRSIAQALGRRFVRVSLGGIRDEAEIRGHRRTYVGALPGRIVQAMKTAGTINPVFMLDEIDKIGLDFRGDPSAALLEVLDPEQNHAFSDHYLDAPYDLSRVMFITTANVLDSVPPALRDRLEVIELPGYVEEDKLQIARRFLIPRQLAENGLTPPGLRFSHGALRALIRSYTYEAGVRGLEREIGAICRKVGRQIAAGRRSPRLITERALVRYLGPPRFYPSTAEARDDVAVATGVAWTPAGGDVITVEVSFLDGTGSYVLTGQLGDVMKESAQAALSYARSRAGRLGASDRFYERTDVHIHVPSGAVPKDGPSAGVTIATALISALTQRPTRRDVAMTGEITLRGRVLPVGGIREKVLAAHRAGVKTVVLPRQNLKDLVEVPADVKRHLRFVAVEHMDEVLPVALHERRAAPAELRDGLDGLDPAGAVAR